MAVFERLVNPGIPIPPEMTKIHRISDEMVASKPTLDQILPEFMEFSRGAVLVAHNAPYDVSMLLVPLIRMRDRPGVEPPENLVLDTCSLAKSTFPGAPSYRLQMVAGMLGVRHEQAHRALSDVRACKEIFLKILGACGPATTLEDLVKRNGSQMHFGATREMLDRIPGGVAQAALLREALRTGSDVLIRYRGGSKGPGPRRVTPITLQSQADALILVAHCHLDRSIKHFRLDQVLAISPPATCV
jgi:DNA polymerase III epsilon subunit family exonuclease